MRGGDRGVALLLVLWALVLLGTLALGFSLSMRTEAMAARNGIDETRAYFPGATGVNRAIVLLASLPADNVLAATIAGRDGDASYEVRIESESGKMDVNLVGGGGPSRDLEKGRASGGGGGRRPGRDPRLAGRGRRPPASRGGTRGVRADDASRSRPATGRSGASGS